MKSEPFSFTPSTSGVTVILDDDTLNVDFIFCQISKNGSNVNASTGFSNGVKHRAKWALDDSIKDSGRTTSYCAYHKKNSSGSAVVAVAGKPAANWNTTTGEFSMSFDTADTSYTVDGYVLGH